MHLLHFENHKDFVQCIPATFASFKSCYDDISIVAKYNEAKEILKELLHLDYDITSVNLDSEDVYPDEYIISILNIDGEFSIWCEKLKRDNGYSNDESTVTYIMGNCSSKVISHCKAKFMYEVSIGEECDQGNTNENLSYNDDSDDLYGFTFSKTDDNGYCSYSFYTSEILTEEDMKDILGKLII